MRPQLPIKAVDRDLTIIPTNFTVEKTNKPDKHLYSNEQIFMPILPKDLKEKYLRFFFDYDNNKEEAQSFMLREDYTLANLVEDLKYDIFVWVASELLFKKPRDYDERSIAWYFKHDMGPDKSGKWYCHENDLKLF